MRMVASCHFPACDILRRLSGAPVLAAVPSQ
jgi:hypothetical protein